MNSDGLSYLVVIRNVELDRELWEKVKHLQKKEKRKREKYSDAEGDSYNKSSPIPGTQTHPHSPVLWICISVYKYIHNNKTFSLASPHA